MIVKGINASGLCWHMPPSGPPSKLVSLTKEFKPSVIRDPGGTLANFADMDTDHVGYGTPTLGNTAVQHHLDEYRANNQRFYERYDVLPLEFPDKIVRMHKETGAAALWVANLRAMDATVSMLTRFGSGGVAVHGVELGNERFLKKYETTVMQYIEQCRIMKQRIPGHKVSMCLKLAGGKKLQEWNAAVIASGLADAYAIHMYQDEATTLSYLSDQLFLLSGQLDKPIWVSEFGIQAAIPNMIDFRDAYREVCLLPSVELVCVHNLIGDGPHGLIQEKRGWFGGNNYSITSYGREVRDLMNP